MAMGGGKGGGGASAGAIRAGAAFVEIFGKDKLSPLLDAIKAKMNAFGSFLGKVGGAGLAAGTAILAPITGLFTAAVDRGKELQILADRFGTTTEAVSGLAYAFETVGVPIEQFADSVKGLSQKLSTAADGQDEIFRRLGLNARELIALPLDQQYARIADALNSVPNPADRARAAMEVLGEAGLKLLPVLKNGAADLAALAREGAEVGAVMSGADAKRATEIAKSTAKAWSAIKYAVMEVGMALLPQSGQIKEAAGWVTMMARQTREWVGANKELVLTVVGVGAGLAAGGAALLAFGLAAKSVAAIFGVIAAAVGAVLSPLGLLTAAVVGLGAVWATQTESGQKFVTDMKAGFEDFAATAKQAWGGVAAAMAKGDLGQAAAVGLSFVGLEWAKATAYWTDVWNKFKAVVVDGWRYIRDMAATSLAYLAGGVGLVPAGTYRTVLQMNDEQQAAARRQRDADLAEAQRRVLAAQAAFQQAVTAAATPHAPVGPGGGPARPGEVSPELLALQRDMSRVFDQAKGGFNPVLARQQFGYGDKVAQRSLTAQEKTAKGVEATVKAIGDLSGDVKRLFSFQ